MSIDASVGLLTGMLAFARSFQISEALLWALEPDGTRRPIIVQEKGVRGQTSNAQSSTSDKKFNPGASNPQIVDIATVPAGCEVFQITFTARIMPASTKPHASDDPKVAANFASLASAYGASGGYRYLAVRYLANILNGRFAWRNRWQADEAEVIVDFAGKTLKANPFDIPFDNFSLATLETGLRGTDPAILTELINTIETGLRQEAVSFSVTWSAKMKGGAEVFPSQEYLRGEAAEKLKGKGNDGGKSRVYAVVPSYTESGRTLQASIHSQKINAAIRHIDDWHDDAEAGPIAVNAYGGMQETGDTLRWDREANDLYTIMRRPELLAGDVQRPAAEMSGDTHFFFANLIRGGVYGVSVKDKEKATAKGAKGRGKTAAAEETSDA